MRMLASACVHACMVMHDATFKILKCHDGVSVVLMLLNTLSSMQAYTSCIHVCVKEADLPQYWMSIGRMRPCTHARPDMWVATAGDNRLQTGTMEPARVCLLRCGASCKECKLLIASAWPSTACRVVAV